MTKRIALPLRAGVCGAILFTAFIAIMAAASRAPSHLVAVAAVSR